MAAFSRSSNSPRKRVPAIIAPRSRLITRLPSRISGTSSVTIFCASPSTMAVFPTPASPISTGLFLVRRLSTWITRRISASRPMTGSSLPSRGQCGQIAAVLFQRAIAALGCGVTAF